MNWCTILGKHKWQHGMAEFKGNPEGIFPEERRSIYGYFRRCERCGLLEGWEHYGAAMGGGRMHYSQETLKKWYPEKGHLIVWEK